MKAERFTGSLLQKVMSAKGWPQNMEDKVDQGSNKQRGGEQSVSFKNGVIVLGKSS